MADADFILLVLNQNEELTVEDEALFEAAAGHNYVVVLNKTDLETKLDINRVRELAGENPIVSTSLVNDEGLEALEEAIKTLFLLVTLMRVMQHMYRTFDTLRSFTKHLKL